MTCKKRKRDGATLPVCDTALLSTKGVSADAEFDMRSKSEGIKARSLSDLGLVPGSVSSGIDEASLVRI